MFLIFLTFYQPHAPLEPKYFVPKYDHHYTIAYAMQL